MLAANKMKLRIIDTIMLIDKAKPLEED